MMEEPRENAAAPPPPPPIGVDRVEFRRGLNDLCRQVKEEGANTRQLVGWLLATIGLLAVLLGAYCMLSRDGGWS